MDHFRTSIWETVGLSKTKEVHFEGEDEYGIEESLPAATAFGTNFFNTDEDTQKVHSGDSSDLISRRKSGNLGGTATITQTSRHNTTFINGVAVGRSYENTTTFRNPQGEIINVEKKYSQAQPVFSQNGEVIYAGSTSAPNRPYSTSQNIGWESSPKRQEQYDNTVEGTSQYNSQYSGRASQRGHEQTQSNQYFDSNGQPASRGHYDESFHTRGQDVRGYGGNVRGYTQEQTTSAGGQYHQSAIENAAAGSGFRTNVVGVRKNTEEDVHAYGGSARGYEQEQRVSTGGQYHQSAIESAAAGTGFRTNIVDVRKDSEQNVGGYGESTRGYGQEQRVSVGGQYHQGAIENAAAGSGFRTNIVGVRKDGEQDVRAYRGNYRGHQEQSGSVGVQYQQNTAGSEGFRKNVINVGNGAGKEFVHCSVQLMVS